MFETRWENTGGDDEAVKARHYDAGNEEGGRVSGEAAFRK